LKYEQVGKTFIGALIIQARYSLLLVMLLPVFVLAGLFVYEASYQDIVHDTISLFLFFMVLMALCTYRSLKHWGRESVELLEEHIRIYIGSDVEEIPLTDIEECIILNIYGNINFEIKHSGKYSGFLTNGLQGDFIHDISKIMGKSKIRKAGFIETIKLMWWPS